MAGHAQRIYRVSISAGAKSRKVGCESRQDSGTDPDTIPIMFGVAIIVFIFMRLTPGDPVDIMMGQGGAISAGEMEQLRSEFHLDEPITTQLWYFLRDAVQGDLGYSYIRKRPVTEIIGERLPATIELAAGRVAFCAADGLPHRHHLGRAAELAAGPVEHGQRFSGHLDAGILAGHHPDSCLFGVVELAAGPGPDQLRINVANGHRFLHDGQLLTGIGPALVSSLRHLVLPSVSPGRGGGSHCGPRAALEHAGDPAAGLCQLARAKGQAESWWSSNTRCAMPSSPR